MKSSGRFFQEASPRHKVVEEKSVARASSTRLARTASAIDGQGSSREKGQPRPPARGVDQECQRRICNYRRLQRDTEKLLRTAFVDAPLETPFQAATKDIKTRMNRRALLWVIKSITGRLPRSCLPPRSDIPQMAGSRPTFCRHLRTKARHLYRRESGQRSCESPAVSSPRGVPLHGLPISEISSASHFHTKG